MRYNGYGLTEMYPRVSQDKRKAAVPSLAAISEILKCLYRF